MFAGVLKKYHYTNRLLLFNFVTLQCLSFDD